MSINKVILVGNVGQDPQVRTVGDQKVASFTLATGERFKGRDGNMVEQTEWHSITIWGKLAEVAESYVKKGTQLYVEGKIKTEKYTDKDGNEKYATRILASSFQLLGSRPEGQQPAPAQQKPKTTQMPYPTETDDSDLPF
jgi:single-strand DNA-binding protein